MSEETMAVVQELREAAADLAEGAIDLLDCLDGDPDFEPEEDVGVEDMPHDAREEGNDEPDDRLIA